MSPTTADVGGIINIAVGALPSILALIRGFHQTQNPTAPPLTDADVFAALAYAVTSTVAIDEAWKMQNFPPVVPSASPPSTTGD